MRMKVQPAAPGPDETNTVTTVTEPTINPQSHPPNPARGAASNHHLDSDDQPRKASHWLAPRMAPKANRASATTGSGAYGQDRSSDQNSPAAVTPATVLATVQRTIRPRISLDHSNSSDQVWRRTFHLLDATARRFINDLLGALDTLPRMSHLRLPRKCNDGRTSATAFGQRPARIVSATGYDLPRMLCLLVGLKDLSREKLLRSRRAPKRRL
jgi:hypothetical protein